MVSNCKHLVFLIGLRHPDHIVSWHPALLVSSKSDPFKHSPNPRFERNVTISAVTVHQRGCPVTTQRHETSHFSTWLKALFTIAYQDATI